MNRATCFALLLALASLPAAADDEKFRAAVRDAVVKEIQERKEAEASKPQDQELHVAANVGDRKRRHLHGVWWSDSDDSLSVANCPMGSRGRTHVRRSAELLSRLQRRRDVEDLRESQHVPGGDLGRLRMFAAGVSGSWRPVERSHALEREQGHRRRSRVVIDTVPEEPAQTPAPPPPRFGARAKSELRHAPIARTRACPHSRHELQDRCQSNSSPFTSKSRRLSPRGSCVRRAPWLTRRRPIPPRTCEPATLH